MGANNGNGASKTQAKFVRIASHLLDSLHFLAGTIGKETPLDGVRILTETTQKVYWLCIQAEVFDKELDIRLNKHDWE